HRMREEALELVKRVLVSHDDAPLEEMERLIALAQDDPALRDELLEGASEVLTADPASLVPCWLALVAAELGPASADVLLSALGTSEGDALDETLFPVLTRRVSGLYDAITAAIRSAAPEDYQYRAALYEVLLAVVVSGDRELGERLGRFAAECIEDERRLPTELGVAAAPEFLTE